MTELSLICTFRVGPLRLGINVDRVQEVIREQRMTRVPGASEFIRGLMNLRGQIVPTFDLGSRLGLKGTTASEQVNVVVRTSDSPVSLLVDEVGEVVLVDSSCFEAPPETLRGSTREFIDGAFMLDDGLLLALNTDAVLDLAA